MKTLKLEEIYANRYRDLGHLHRHLTVFIEQYYNRARLHSALGYCPPEEFEQAVRSVTSSDAEMLLFFQPTEEAEPERSEDVKKNVRPTRVCYFRILNGGVHPLRLC